MKVVATTVLIIWSKSKYGMPDSSSAEERVKIVEETARIEAEDRARRTLWQQESQILHERKEMERKSIRERYQLPKK